MRNLLAAGIVRDYEFICAAALEVYLYKLDHDCRVYKILDQHTRDDGTVLIRILFQYNNSPLIELF